MKPAFAIAAGVIVGLLLAGAIAPALILILPSRLRGVGAVWSSTALVVVFTASVGWLLATRASRKSRNVGRQIP